MICCEEFATVNFVEGTVDYQRLLGDVI